MFLLCGWTLPLGAESGPSIRSLFHFQFLELYVPPAKAPYLSSFFTEKLIAYQREFHALKERLRVAEHRTLQRSSELNNILEQFRRAIAETNSSKDALTNFSGKWQTHKDSLTLTELLHSTDVRVSVCWFTSHHYCFANCGLHFTSTRAVPDWLLTLSPRVWIPDWPLLNFCKVFGATPSPE